VFFVWLNFRATAGRDMFEWAEKTITGPRPVRVLISIAWYLQHVLWPAGLASWYPRPPTVRWWDPLTLRALLVVAAGGALLFAAARRWRAAGLGVAWFLLTIVDTLPIVPARNVFVADRYIYLSIIGLLWCIATAAAVGWRWFAHAWYRRAAAVVVGLGAVAVLLPVSWHTAWFYETMIRKTGRIAALFPDTPHAWSRLAAAYSKEAEAASTAGRPEEAARLYHQAIEYAKKELEKPERGGWGEAYQVMGACYVAIGRIDEALASFRRAIELEPIVAEPQFGLAVALDDLGRHNEALPLYEAVFAKAPGHNRTLLRLAKLYRGQGRVDAAREKYEQAIRNNAYEVPAILGLSELDLEAGTPATLAAAERRLTGLLEWMPENTPARTNLGVVLQRLGRTHEAIESYRKVLQQNPDDVTATLNLAQLLHSQGNVARARPLFDRVADIGPESVDQAVAVQDFYFSQRLADRAAAMWETFLSRSATPVEGRGFAAWSNALAGRVEQARSLAHSVVREHGEHPLAVAALAYVSLAEGDYEGARSHVATLSACGLRGAEARRRFLAGLEFFDEKHTGVAWTFYLAAVVLHSEGQADKARVFADLFDQHCVEAACDGHRAGLRALLRSDESAGAPGK